MHGIEITPFFVESPNMLIFKIPVKSSVKRRFRAKPSRLLFWMNKYG